MFDCVILRRQGLGWSGLSPVQQSHDIRKETPDDPQDSGRSGVHNPDAFIFCQMVDALILRRAYKGSRFQLPQSLRVWEGGSARVSAEAVTPLFLLCAFVIAASLLLGGGTRGGFLRDAILELIAIPLLLVALWKLFDGPITQQMKIPLFFCLAIAFIPVVQLIPLPPWLWSNLPGRGPAAETFEILGQAPPWMPISVVPYETWLSALSLVPPLSIFLAAMQLSYRERRWLTWVFITIGVVSVFIGLAQVAQGPTSPLRFFEFTNETEAVGFFANRNHLAALLYSVTLFAAVWAIGATQMGQPDERKTYDTILIVALLAAFTLLAVLLAGQMMARSRMGLLLTIVALFGALAIAVWDRRVGSQVTPMKLIVGAVVLVVIFAAQFGLYRIMERFTGDPLADARIPFTRNTIEAALAYLPFGSGVGTFVPVYAMFEKPADLIADRYANHAHNDYVELWLTAGLMGLVLVAMFMAWFGLRAFEIWRKTPPAGASELDWDLARAATLIVALLLAHSLVEYPLRTGGIMALMAFACALLIDPPLRTAPTAVPTPKRTREADKVLQPREKTALPQQPPPGAKPAAPPPSSTPAAPPPASTPATASPPAPQLPGLQGGALAPDQRWNADDIEWPEEWSKKPGSARDSGGQKSKGSKQPKGS